MAWPQWNLGEVPVRRAVPPRLRTPGNGLWSKNNERTISCYSSDQDRAHSDTLSWHTGSYNLYHFIST